MVPLTPPNPPTDSLYKFIAIGGLAIAIFFRWSRLQVQITSYRLERDAMLDADAHIRKQFAVWSDGFKKLADDLDAGLILDKDTAMKRSKEIRDLKPKDHEEFLQSFADSAMAMGKHLRETDPERHIQLALSLFGVVMSSVGFWLWWVRVQKPYDELMRLQLDAARRESQKSTGPPISGSTG